jgi:hypothetical protein
MLCRRRTQNAEFYGRRGRIVRRRDGDYEPGKGSRVTLSKAEREHAEAAGVSVEEYGRQKLKMLRMKKAKILKDE